MNDTNAEIYSQLIAKLQQEHENVINLVEKLTACLKTAQEQNNARSEVVIKPANIEPARTMKAALLFGTDEAIPAGEEFYLSSSAQIFFRPEQIVIPSGMLVLLAADVGGSRSHFQEIDIPEGFTHGGVVGGVDMRTCKPGLGITLYVRAVQDIPAHFSFYIKGATTFEHNCNQWEAVDGLPIAGIAKEVKRQGHVTFHFVKEMMR